MERTAAITLLVLVGGLGLGCSRLPVAPTSDRRAADPTTAGLSLQTSGAFSDPALPPFNLEAVLHDVTGGNGFGLVKFRQPKDDDVVINLDVWVRDLAPQTRYSLERAVDQTLDDVCTSTAWLTLGQGLTPAAIVTDERGTGRAALFRALPGALVDQAFDIHFRVVPEGMTTPVLQSDCYRFIATP